MFFPLPEDLSVQAWRKEGICGVVRSFSTGGEACRTRASVVLCHSHEGDLEGEEFTGQNQVPKSDCLLKFGSFGHLEAFYSFFCRPLHLAVDWCHLALLEATPSGLGCPQGVEGSFLHLMGLI